MMLGIMAKLVCSCRSVGWDVVRERASRSVQYLHRATTQGQKARAARSAVDAIDLRTITDPDFGCARSGIVEGQYSIGPRKIVVCRTRFRDKDAGKAGHELSSLLGHGINHVDRLV